MLDGRWMIGSALFFFESLMSDYGISKGMVGAPPLCPGCCTSHTVR